MSLAANSTVRERWFTKMGIQKKRPPIRSLGSICAKGGLVSAIDVLIIRRYATVYLETLPDGTKVARSAEEEEYAQKQYEVSIVLSIDFQSKRH